MQMTLRNQIEELLVFNDEERNFEEMPTLNVVVVGAENIVA